MRLNLMELPLLHGGGGTVHVRRLEGDRREELLRRIRGQDGPPAPSYDVDARPAPTADDDQLGALLARGVGRTITADGLEWLLHRHDATGTLPPGGVQSPCVEAVLAPEAVAPNVVAQEIATSAVSAVQDPVTSSPPKGGASRGRTRPDVAPRRRSTGRPRARSSGAPVDV